MTAADKTNLDNTVQGLANEITDRTNAINALRTELKPILIIKSPIQVQM